MVEVARLDLVVRNEQAVRSNRELQAELGKTADRGERAGQKLRGAFDEIKNSIFSVRGALTALGAGFTFNRVFQTIAQFERSMSGVRAVTGATGNEFQALQEEARRLGAVTQFTAAQAAEGMRFLGQAGFETREILASIEPSLRLAQAGALGLAEAADIVSNIMSGFRIEAEQTSEVGDILAATAANANTNIRQMGEAMKFVAPIAASTGQNIEEISAAVGVLGNAGLQASLAGTGLRQTLLALANPTKNAAEAIQALGLTVEQLDPTTNSIVEIVNRLAEANISAAEASEIFGDRAATAVLALTAATDEFEELLVVTGDATGALDEMSKVMEDNLANAARALNSAFEELILQTGDQGLGPALRDGIDLLTGVIREMTGLTQAGDENADMFRNLATAIEVTFGALAGLFLGRIAGRFAALAVEIGGARGAMLAFNAAVRANPIGLAVTAAGALLGVVIALQEEETSLAKAIRQTNEVMDDAILSSGDLTEARKREALATLELAEAEVDRALTLTTRQLQTQREAARKLARASPFSPLLRSMQEEVGNLATELRDLNTQARVIDEARERLMRPMPTPERPERPPLTGVSDIAGGRGRAGDRADPTDFERIRDALKFEIELLGKKDELEKAVATTIMEAKVPATSAEAAELRKLVTELDRGTQALEMQNELEQRAAELKQQAITPQQELNASITEYNDLLAQGLITQDEYNRLMDQAAQKFEQTDESAQLLNATTDRLGSAFGTFFTTMATGAASAEDAVKRLTQSLIQMAQEMLVNQAMSALFTGIFSAAGAGVGTGAGASTAGTGAGSLPGSGGLVTTGYYSEGGRVGSQGQRRMPAAAFAGAPRAQFGFRAGEFPIVAHAGERVLTAQQTRNYERGGGGRNVNVTVIDQNDSNITARSEENSQGDLDLILYVEQRMADKIVKGGPLSDAMEQRFNVRRDTFDR